MNIYGKNEIKPTFFKDLKSGEVFYFLKDCKDIRDGNIGIYMRSEGEELKSYKKAINLESGNCYQFDDYEQVQVLDATINVKLK